MSVRAKRHTPRQRDSPRGDRDWWEHATNALVMRSGGRCERCGRDLTDGRTSVSRHHRVRRRDGGDRLSNLLLLCGTGTTGCHGHVTEHPTEAYASGWSVRALSVDQDPSTVPVRLADGHWWLLDDQGGKRPVP